MTVPLATTMRLADELEAKAEYMPTPEEIRSEAAKIRKTWSPREKAKRLIFPLRAVAWQLPEVAGTPAGFNPRLTGVGTFYNDDGFSR